MKRSRQRSRGMQLKEKIRVRIWFITIIYMHVCVFALYACTHEGITNVYTGTDERWGERDVKIRFGGRRG